jgi:C4-dicarboxylate transporter DctM subunit
VVAGLGYGRDPNELKIWFGIITDRRRALITPPVGLNVFIINSLDPSVPCARRSRA